MVRDCEEATVELTTEAFCFADSFEWSLSDGVLLSGNGTSNITIKPPLQGSFTATVVAKRSSGNPAYTKTHTETINRTGPEAELEIIHNESSAPNFICKGIGQEFGTENQDNIINIEWSAFNSTVSNETTANGKRLVTITPNYSFINGSLVNINATVYYEGGCTALTPTKSFTVYEAETPPSPQGYVYMEPLPEGASVCDAQGFKINFVASNPYNNGITSLSQAVLPPHAANQPYPITVWYFNPCSGQRTSTTFYTSPPIPCGDPVKPLSDMTVSPNPSKGNLSISFNQKITGTYSIYNSSGAAITKGEIKESEILTLILDSKYKRGNYFIEIKTNDNKITKQIILE